MIKLAEVCKTCLSAMKLVFLVPVPTVTPTPSSQNEISLTTSSAFGIILDRTTA